MREREIEKITIQRGVTQRGAAHVHLRAAATAARPFRSPRACSRRACRRIAIGRLTVEKDEDDGQHRHRGGAARSTAPPSRPPSSCGSRPRPATSRIRTPRARSSTAWRRSSAQDRTSLMALTALKRYDNYTFTHMVNVSVLAMAQARSLNMDGPLLREFGFAALMHDIGKVHTPLEVLNKPDKLTQRRVRDHAAARRRRRAHPAPHAGDAGAGADCRLRASSAAGPVRLPARTSATASLNLCTQIVSIADVYDALRSNRVYREGLPSDRIKSIMGKKDDPAFNQKLLRRFINLIGLFPIGTLVRLNTEEIGVVTHEHPDRSVPAAGEDRARSRRGAAGRARSSSIRGSPTAAASTRGRSSRRWIRNRQASTRWSTCNTDGRSRAPRSTPRWPSGSRNSRAPARRRCAPCRSTRADTPRSAPRSDG